MLHRTHTHTQSRRISVAKPINILEKHLRKNVNIGEKNYTDTRYSSAKNTHTYYTYASIHECSDERERDRHFGFLLIYILLRPHKYSSIYDSMLNLYIATLSCFAIVDSIRFSIFFVHPPFPDTRNAGY